MPRATTKLSRCPGAAPQIFEQPAHDKCALKCPCDGPQCLRTAPRVYSREDPAQITPLKASEFEPSFSSLYILIAGIALVSLSFAEIALAFH